VIPDSGSSHRLPQVIADRDHRPPNNLHRLDENLVDAIGISFRIKHGNGKLYAHYSITLLTDAALR
jgi:hypothetical protein